MRHLARLFRCLFQFHIVTNVIELIGLFSMYASSILCTLNPGLLISNIDIDIDSIDDTFRVSISVSTVLLGRGIESSIDDTFEAVFPIFRYRYF